MPSPGRSPFRRSLLRTAASSACLALAACPQLLDDTFEERMLPPVGLTSSSGTGGFAGASVDPDASVPSTGGAPSGNAGSAGSGAAGSAAGGGTGPEADAGSDPAGSGGSSTGDSGAPGPGASLRAALLHRYRFDEAGSTILDSIGTAHGTAVNAQVSAGSGKIVLDGTSAFVDLPNGLISGLSSVTLETWVNWAANPLDAAAEWQTLLSFGNSTAGEGSPGVDGSGYVHVTAMNGDSDDLRGGYTLTGYNAELFVEREGPLPISLDPTRGTQVVLVIRGAAGAGGLALYVDGVLQEASPGGQVIDLGAIADVNNWLGRSQFSSDPLFHGEILEFRVYGSALEAADVALSHSLGPDAEL